MLDFDRYDETPATVEPGVLLGACVRLVWDQGTAMGVTVRRGARTGDDAPTLVIRGHDRAPDDWFGVEVEVTSQTEQVALTLRNYPVQRLFPRLHVERAGKVAAVDLPDVAAHDAFATRVFDARQWRQDAALAGPAPDSLRLTVLVPSTPWFAMELAGVQVTEAAHA